MKFIYIETKTAIKEYQPIIFDLLDSYFKIDNYEQLENSLIIYYHYEKQTVGNLLISLSQDLLIDILIYESIFYNQETSLKKALETFLKIKENHYLQYKYYNNKQLLEEGFDSLNVRKLVLSNYYNDLEMYKTIIGFLENDQNITKSSKMLYLHRNTLDMRLTKFKTITNFDLKKFKDAYLIYRLLK